MTVEEMRRQKALRKLTIEELSHLSGVPVSTIAKVLAGITKNPRYSTRIRLEAVLMPLEEPPEELPEEKPESFDEFPAYEICGEIPEGPEEMEDLGELTYERMDGYDDCDCRPEYIPDDDVLMDGDWREPPDPAPDDYI